MSKGGGGSRPSGPQEVTQISSNLPDYAEPYFRKALERTVYESARPYQTYTGSRMADFDAGYDGYGCCRNALADAASL